MEHGTQDKDGDRPGVEHLVHLRGRGELDGVVVTATVMVARREGSARSVVDVDTPAQDLLRQPDVLASAVLVSTPAGPRVSRLSIPDPRLRALPALCFSLRDDTRTAPAMLLEAYDPVALGVQADTFLTPSDIDGLRARGRSTEPVGYLRWLVGSGEIHQVTAVLRRRKVATRLLMAAEVTCAAHGWPLLRGGSERTELGDALVSSSSNPSYWAERANPMVKLSSPAS